MIKTLRSEVLTHLLQGAGRASRRGYHPSSPLLVKTRLKKRNGTYEPETVFTVDYKKEAAE